LLSRGRPRRAVPRARYLRPISQDGMKTMSLSHRFPTLLGLAALLFPSLAYGQEGAPDIASQARSVLKLYCQRCHSRQGSDSGLDFDVLRPDTMTVKGEDGKGPILVPGKPDESPLFRATAKRMPPKG